MTPFLTALDQATGPAFAALIVALLTYLLPLVRDLFLAWVASFRQPVWTDLATTAVHWMEQTMATGLPAQKKRTAVAWAVGHGVPESLAGPLIEQAVHAMNAAATADLARQQVTTTIQGVTATTLPGDLLPLPQPVPPAEPVSIVAQLLAEAPALAPLLAGFLSPAPPPAVTPAPSPLIVPPGMASVPVEAGTS